MKTRVLIVGSGGTGLSIAVKLKKAGVEDFMMISKHGDFGGAWYQNRYPGCTTDGKVEFYQFDYALTLE